MRYLIAAGICLLLIFAGMHISAPQSWRSDSLSVGAAEAKSDEGEQYNLSSIVVLTRVISYIKNYYFDPARIDPQKMFKSALEAVARSIPSVMVDFDEVSRQVRVRVDTSEEQFNFGDVNTVWKIQYRLSEIFRFLQPYLESGVDPKDVEFSAINGMLDTLDPHSVHMTPSLYRDLKMSTIGNFGGLGIQIGIREGKLTTIAPLRDTPAWRAGMKSNDHIQRIDGQSTVNMSLDEAVRLMRGKRGTGVKLTIMRKGWSAPKTMEIIRDIIPINSIHHKLLPGKIGFVQISNFQGNTVKDLKKALAEMKSRGNLQGLILDLRINPGGLLDSAVKVSDLFLDSGTIVTTVGAGNERLEMSQANFMNTEEKYPIAVLIGPSSASASEIVAGALKNNNRAVLIGERTFGKGSVQVLYDMDDGSALKLTVAQYLTPGDVSIQSVGVVPDISLMPVLIEKENIEFYSYEHMRREKDLEHHLDHKATIQDKPFESLHYLYDEKRDEIDIDAPMDTVNTEDFIIQFAYKMLRNVGNISRREIILQRAVSYLKQVMQKEDGLIVESLKKMGIDWRESAEPGRTQAKVEILSNPEGALKAGEVAEITLKVTNIGQHPFVRLRAMTESDNPYLASLEFFLGRVDPGKTGSWKAKITIPEDMSERADDVVFKFYDQGGSAPAGITRRIDVSSKPGPDFAYTFQIVDEKSNGDGLIQKDEMIELLLNIENIGEGPVVEGLVILKNTDNLKEVFIHTGRAKFDAIKPGERALTRFVFQVKQEFTGESFPMEILVMDSTMRRYLSDKITFHIASPLKWEAVGNDKAVDLVAGSSIFGSPDERLPTVSVLENTDFVKVLATAENWAKVVLDDQRFGWVMSAGSWNLVDRKQCAKPGLMITRHLPVVSLTESSETLYTADEHIQIDGKVTDDNHIQDMYILRNGKKIYFKSNKKAANPLAMKFSALVELEEGSNVINIVARENNKFQGRKSVIVYRKKSPDDGKLAEKKE